MRASLIATGALTSALVLATVALAEPRGPRQKNAAPPATAGSSSATPAASGDATSLPAPPPPSDIGPAGARLSPLNPLANEFADGGPAPTSIDYDRVLADVASLRARVAAVSDILFHSRLAISVETSGDHGRIAALSVALDDGTIFASPGPFRAEDATIVYDHAVAPGHHAVTIDLERRDDRNEVFRSSQRSRFIVDVPADGRLLLDIRLWDDSSIGGQFANDKKGAYDLRVRAEAKVQPHSQGK